MIARSGSRDVLTHPERTRCEKRIVLCPKHRIKMRPIRNERGKMIDTCYRCEREKKQEDDSTVIEKLRKRDREEE
jgi:CBS-domain-containing membrane protein